MQLRRSEKRPLLVKTALLLFHTQRKGTEPRSNRNKQNGHSVLFANRTRSLRITHSMIEFDRKQLTSAPKQYTVFACLIEHKRIIEYKPPGLGRASVIPLTG